MTPEVLLRLLEPETRVLGGLFPAVAMTGTAAGTHAARFGWSTRHQIAEVRRLIVRERGGDFILQLLLFVRELFSRVILQRAHLRTMRVENQLNLLPLLGGEMQFVVEIFNQPIR